MVVEGVQEGWTLRYLYLLPSSYGCITLGQLRRWVGCISVYYTLAWCVECIPV